MTKLDHTSSSLIEIDSHALHTVAGGIHFLSGGSTSAAKKTGKGKQILGELCLLGCQIIGPHHPNPGGEIGGPFVGRPQGRPPAGAPPTTGGPKPVPVPGGGEIIIPE